jgi:putative peptidoglycan lipid II flippase
MGSVDTQLAHTVASAVERKSRWAPRSLAATLLSVFVVTLLSKALGFLSQVLVTSLFGTTRQADTYYFAFSIVNIVSGLVVGSVGFILIPLYIEKKEREGVVSANEFANAMLTCLFLILALLSVLMALLATPLVGTLSRFPAGLRPLAIRVLAAAAPLALLSGMGQLLMALSQARKRFVSPAFTGVLHSVVFISVLLAAWKWLGVYALVLAVTVSTVLQAVMMLGLLAKDGKVRPSLCLPRGEVRTMLLLSWPLVLSQMLSTVQVMTTRSIASGLVVGSVAALAYAEALKSAFLDLCVVPVAQISLPHFSERIARRENGPAWEQLQGALAALWFLVVPVVVLLWVLSGPLVQVFYQRGAFTAQSTALTASALAFFSLGLLGESAHYLVSRYFLALKDTRTLTWLGVPITGSYVILVIVLSDVLWVRGIALGHSLVMVVNMAAALFLLRKKLNLPFARSFRNSVTKIAVSCLVMLLLSQFAFSLLSVRLRGDFRSCLVEVVVVGVVGAGSYLASSLFAGITTDIPLLLRLHPRKLLAELTARI